MKVCLDTSFIIDVFREKIEAISKMEELEAVNAEFILSTIALFEIYFGYFVKPKLKNFEAIKTLLELRNLKISTLNKEIAIQAARIQADLQRQGLLNQVPDLLIGVTALQEDAIMLTRDIDDFKNIPGLVVQTW